MVIHKPDCYGKDNSRKCYWNLIGNVCLFTENMDYSYRCAKTTKNGWKKQNMAPMWKKLMINVHLDEPASFVDHVFWGCTQRERKPNEVIIKQCTQMLESRVSAGATEMLPGWENFTQKPRRGPTTLKDMLGGASRDTVNWQTKKWTSFTKFQVFGWMIINSSRKNFNQWENYHKCAHRLCYNACTWHELVDETVYSLWTKLQEQSKNEFRLATNDWQGWFRTIITQTVSDNIVMSVTRLSIVAWIHFKTQTLLVTLRTQNPPWEESYVSSEAENVSPSFDTDVPNRLTD